MTLTEFLLARIAEDKDEARDARYDISDHWWLPQYASPARVLAECEAMRRIVENHSRLIETGPDSGIAAECADCWQTAPCSTLRLISLPYADHPDYREEWRP